MDETQQLPVPATGTVDPEIVTTVTRMDFSKDDVVDVAVLSAEREINENLSKANGRYAKAKDTFDKASQKLARLIETELTKTIDPRKDEGFVTLRDAFAEAYSDSPHANRPVLEVEISAENKGDFLGDKIPKKFVYTVSVTVRGSYHHLPPFKREMSTPTSVLDAWAERTEAKESLEQATQDRNIWLAAQQRMPQFRREVRAKLAEAKLRETVGGRKILQTIMNNMGTNVLHFGDHVQRQLAIEAESPPPPRRRRR